MGILKKEAQNMKGFSNIMHGKSGPLFLSGNEGQFSNNAFHD
jgi:hypothetical protein